MASANLTLGHHGQPITVTIQGRVVDEFGEGIASAGVSVLRGGQTLKNTQSGQLGQFEVRNLETKIGFHEVRAAKRGWRASEEKLPITKEDEGKSIAIVLRLQSEEGSIRGEERRGLSDFLFRDVPLAKEERDEEWRVDEERRQRERADKERQRERADEERQRERADEERQRETADEERRRRERVDEERRGRERADEERQRERVDEERQRERADEERRRERADEESERVGEEEEDAGGDGHAEEHAIHQYVPDMKPYEKVRVFFATDRNRQLRRGKVDPKKFFGNDRSPTAAISFGYCDVSIPAEHQIGKIERPSIFRLYMERPDKHVVLLRLETLGEAQFFQSVEAKASKTADILFFVHGYHVTFPEAIRRTGQIASDLNFSGTPICYSWPSAGKYSGYPADEASVEWTIPHLLKVLRKTASLPKVRTIHLIAHSMGNRALIRCLEEISTAFTKDSRSRFQQIVLAAPDIDAGVFVNLAEKIIPAAKHITMYASSHDLPLTMSKQFHSYPRAGETGENMTIVPNIDTVDASAVPSDILGHSYYGDSRTILSDIHSLFENGKLPPRFGLKKAIHLGKLYWVFVP